FHPPAFVPGAIGALELHDAADDCILRRQQSRRFLSLLAEQALLIERAGHRFLFSAGEISAPPGYDAAETRPIPLSTNSSRRRSNSSYVVKWTTILPRPLPAVRISTLVPRAARSSCSRDATWSLRVRFLRVEPAIAASSPSSAANCSLTIASIARTLKPSRWISSQ